MGKSFAKEKPRCKDFSFRAALHCVKIEARGEMSKENFEARGRRRKLRATGAEKKRPESFDPDLLAVRGSHVYVMPRRSNPPCFLHERDTRNAADSFLK
jgi:hypothetical protein